MKSEDIVGVTYVNTVIGRGSLNNVVNLSFSTFLFTPSDDGKTVDLDPVVACRLRMDRVCAIQLRDVMNDLIASIEKAESDAASGVAKPNTEDLSAKPAAKDIN